ncbi:hypothetical protein P3H15_40875 [Rhodococcus sp. T2V]|uniref:hypothetical protein n=1 Tax=Rhodococcus sp. T2V TaxID=3034164 RepID=UPI0023E1199A|nr:hypothetical protein [Rhodococcus sp. T2V]MDF3311347.1 hypothetical protein [Rhodococcus sp. T2V]
MTVEPETTRQQGNQPCERSAGVTERSERPSPDAREVVAYALKWMRWGGGEAEDIFVHFGVDPPRFFLRVRKLLSTPASRIVTPEDKAELRRICAVRLNPTRSDLPLGGATERDGT